MEIECFRTKLIGRGGFGSVFEGTWGGKQVAVKRIELLGQINDDANIEIKREEEALKKCDHPNVIKLFHVESSEDFKFYALELCRASVDKLFLGDGDPKKYNGPVPYMEDILIQLAAGLEYIHDLQLVHRDIKPANALIWVRDSAENGRGDETLIKWADFGLCKGMDKDGTFSMSGIKGSLPWFAPETLESYNNNSIESNQHFDQGTNKTEKKRPKGSAKSDIFAEGLTFAYILLKGRRLKFKTDSNGTPLLPDELEIATYLKEIPAAAVHGMLLHKVIKEMLKTNPTERLTAKEVVERLEPLKNKGKSLARRPAIHETEINLQCSSVTNTTMAISWNPLSWSLEHSEKIETVSSYLIDYWIDDKLEFTFSQHSTEEENFTLERLVPDSPYCIQVRNVFKTSAGKIFYSAASPPLKVRTNPSVRFAEMIVKKCRKINNQNGIDLYAVPLTKSSGFGTAADYFDFGKSSGAKKGGAVHRNEQMQHRTVLMMGATGSGKTTLINAMINYIFDVRWDDPFRFQLIEEQLVGGSQAHSQTSKISTYTIHYSEGFRVPYSLTIVDTPSYGDTRGPGRDQETTEMIRKFFEDKKGIQELDVVGFVAQASFPRLTPTQIYIFDSVLSIFGIDMKENINFLLTFADSQIPAILNAIKEAGLPLSTTDEQGNPHNHRFNNAGFFCSNCESSEASNATDIRFNRFYWRMGMENFEKFFNELATMKTKSLSLTKQVLEERKQREEAVNGLHPLIRIGFAKMEEMGKTQKLITNSQAQIGANEKFEFEVEVTVPVIVDLPAGQYLTNCNKCQFTCCNPCTSGHDMINCSAMDRSMPAATRSCLICPEKCIWNMHVNQPYRWEYVKEKRITSSNEMKKKYETALKDKRRYQELLEEIQRKFDQNEKKMLLELVTVVSSCTKRLDEIALRPNPFSSTTQYIDMIIKGELLGREAGFRERVESWKKLRDMSAIITKIKNRENLLDRIYDDA